MAKGAFTVQSYDSSIDIQTGLGFVTAKKLRIGACADQHGYSITGTLTFVGTAVKGSFTKDGPFNSTFDVHLPESFFEGYLATLIALKTEKNVTLHYFSEVSFPNASDGSGAPITGLTLQAGEFFRPTGCG